MSDLDKILGKDWAVSETGDEKLFHVSHKIMCWKL